MLCIWKRSFPHASLNTEAAIQEGVCYLPRHYVFSEIKIAGVRLPLHPYSFNCFIRCTFNETRMWPL